MNKTSWRHHYLPIFYLKRFTNENDKFLIFKKEENRFIKNGKEFPPSAYFYEKNANTLFKDNKGDDFLETEFFAKFDNEIAKLFELIHSSNSHERFSMTDDEMPTMQKFVSLMYWRSPYRKENLKDYLLKEGFKGFGLFFKNNDGTTDEKTKEFEIKYENDSEFRKILGYRMSEVDTVKMMNCRTPLTIQPFHLGLPHVCSDNPVLFETKDKPKVYEDDFIFPISGDLLFIRANRTKKFSISFKLMVDTLIFKQAIKYASFSDEKYYHLLNDFFDKSFKSVDELRQKIFEYLKVSDDKL